MVKTPAERQREYMLRKQQKEKLASRENVEPFKVPFHKFWEESGDWTGFSLPLALAGIETPEFDDDRGPEHFVLPHAVDGLNAPFDPNDPFDRRAGVSGYGSIGRAEVMIDCLLDAAASLASSVQHYKTREIMTRLAELEASDLSDAETKKAALKESARLNKMLDQLNKQVRHTLPQWKVTG